MTRNVLLAVLSVVLAGFLGCLNTGCQGANGKVDPVLTVQTLKEAGFEGKARFFYDSAAHFGGFAYEPFGSASGYIEVDINPGKNDE